MKSRKVSVQILILVMIIFVQLGVSNKITSVKAQVEDGMIPPTIISVVEDFECTQTTYANTNYGLIFATATTTSSLNKRSIYLLSAENMDSNTFKVIKTINISDIDLFYPSITQIGKNKLVLAFTMTTNEGYRIGIMYTEHTSGELSNFTWSSIKIIGSGNVSYVHPALVNNNGNISLIYAANHTGIFNLYEMELNATLYEIKNETQITTFTTNVLQPRVLKHGEQYYMTFIKDNDESQNSTDYDIYITSSPDLYNWTTAILAAENDENENHNDMMPSLFIDNNGVFTIYFESEITDGHRIYSASSADGKTWLRAKQFWLDHGIDPVFGVDNNGKEFLMFSSGYSIQQLMITRQVYTISIPTPKIDTDMFSISISLSDIRTNEPGMTVEEYSDLQIKGVIYEIPPGLSISNSTDVTTLTNISTFTLNHDIAKDLWSAELFTLNFDRGKYAVKIYFIASSAQGASPISVSFEIKIDRQLIYMSIIGAIAIVAIALWFRHIKKKER